MTKYEKIPATDLRELGRRMLKTYKRFKWVKGDYCRGRGMCLAGCRIYCNPSHRVKLLFQKSVYQNTGMVEESFNDGGATEKSDVIKLIRKVTNIPKSEII